MRLILKAAKSYPEGTIRTHGGKKVKKTAQGWRPVGGEKRKPSKVSSSGLKAWFGGSKVVDQKGNPKAVYHGTIDKFVKFDLSEAGSASGFGEWGAAAFFTEDKQVARVYAGHAASLARMGDEVIPKYVKRLFLKVEKPFDLTKMYSIKEAVKLSGQIMPKAKVKISAPITGWDLIKEKWGVGDVMNKKGMLKIRKALIKAGYDGLTQIEENESLLGSKKAARTWAVFDVENIRSANKSVGGSTMAILRKGAAGTRGVPDGSGPEGKGPTGRRQGDCPKKEDYDSTFEWRKAYLKWKKKNGAEDDVEKSKSDVVVLQPSEIQRLQKSQTREKILFVKEQ